MVSYARTQQQIGGPDTGLYYPVSDQGRTYWIPVPPGSAPTINDRPRNQIPAGATIYDAGMDTQVAPGTYAGGGITYPSGQTAAQRAATMLYNAMRGLPFISPEFLSALQAGQAPAPRTVTPQTLAALSADSTLSDAFFSVIRGNALYPTSYLAEIGRYIPRGREATPSFI